MGGKEEQRAPRLRAPACEGKREREAFSGPRREAARCRLRWEPPYRVKEGPRRGRGLTAAGAQWVMERRAEGGGAYVSLHLRENPNHGGRSLGRRPAGSPAIGRSGQLFALLGCGSHPFWPHYGGQRAIQTQCCSSLSRPPALGRKATGSSCRGWRAGDRLVGPCRDFAPPRPLPLHRSPAQRHDHFRCPYPLPLPSGRVPGPTRVPVMSQRSIDVLA